ncbi:MAG TPA: hypothetical protein VJ438_02845 [Candidatus Nanoarchaeia archaeon]|nr:hypothetical protein [Candidatus Nanoarchaeia archaeon]
MKKEVIVLLLLGILFVLPIISAQEQSQTYSGFNRFIDNARMFFSSGDNKVILALEIREKEVNSAFVNTENSNEKGSDKNLEKAWEKLQTIQEKVSVKTAAEVKENSKEMRETIMEKENLPETFEVYALEEEKTELTAEWVIETKATEVEQNRTIEIENRIDVIDNEISNWVVEHTYAEGTSAGGESGVVVEGGLVRVVKTEVAQGDNGLKPEVKTYVAGDGTMNEEPLPEPDLNAINPDLENPDTTTHNVDEGDGGQGDYAEGTTAGGDCGAGVRCGGEGDVVEGGEGTEGVNEEPSPAVDSNEGDSAPTGEAIKEIEPSDNFLTRFFKSIFGR